MRLVIPLEIQNREIDGAISIAYEALKKNWKVYIGQKQQVWPFIDIFDSSYWFLKSLLPGELKLLKKIKKKHIIGSLDIEALVTVKDKYGFFIYQRYSEKSCQLSDLIFFYGKDHLSNFKKYIKADKKKLIITGSPNYDFYKKFNFKKKKIYEFFIASSFGINSSKEQNLLNLDNELTKQAVLIENDNFFEEKLRYDEMLSKYSKKYFELTIYLAKKFKKKKILFRTHPRENLELWKKKFKDYPNIKFSQNNSILDDLLISKKFIHFNSTTSFLSNFLKIPTYMFIEKKCKFLKYMNSTVINNSNIINSFNLNKPKILNNLKNYIYNIDNNNASELIVKSFDGINLIEKKNLLHFDNKIVKVYFYFIFHFKRIFGLKILGILSLFIPMLKQYRYGLWPYKYKFTYKEQFKKKWQGLSKEDIIKKLTLLDKSIKKKIIIVKHISGLYELKLNEKK